MRLRRLLAAGLLIAVCNLAMAGDDAPADERESPSLRQPLPELSTPQPAEEEPVFSTEVPPPPPFTSAPDSAR